MHLCLFEDGSPLLEPLSLTRPIFDLRCGVSTLAEKQLQFFGAGPVSVLIRPHLAPLYRLQHPDREVNNSNWLRAESTVLINGRWLPPERGDCISPQPHIAVNAGEVAYALLTREHLHRLRTENLLEDLDKQMGHMPVREVGGWILRCPWDVVEENGRQIEVDFHHAFEDRASAGSPALAVIGPLSSLFLDPAARVEPMVVADTTGGPVIIDRGAVVSAFTRLEGPCYIGPHTHVLGAKIRGGTTIGPHCRVGGEIEASIVHGYSNKYHEGFLGHSYIGEWVNLAAGTNNSDLRNDYGEVTVTIAGRRIDTALTKVGCFIGDHSKTGLGTLINTGTTIGAFCNLLPAGPLAPRYLPSFTTWWNGVLRETPELNALLETAHTVMQRRGCTLTTEHETLYRHLFAETATERCHALGDAEQRRLRRSA